MNVNTNTNMYLDTDRDVPGPNFACLFKGPLSVLEHWPGHGRRPAEDTDTDTHLIMDKFTDNFQKKRALKTLS